MPGVRARPPRMEPVTWLLQLHGQARLSPSGPGSGAWPAIELIEKDAGWLAHAALEGPLPSARLAALLWPERDEKQALNNLRQRVYKLRRATGARLVEMAQSFALAPDLVLAPPPGDGPAAPAVLLGSLAFDGCPELAAWLQGRREADAKGRRHRRAQRCDELAERGELDAALLLAEQLLAEDPLSEIAHRRVLRLHYLMGNAAAAVRAFEACRQTLWSELRVRPAAETLALVELVQRAIAPAPAAATAGLAGMTGLLRPPVMVGRDDALHRVRHCVASGVPVLVSGEAGLGKTRLLQHAAALEPGACGVRARAGDAEVPLALLRRLAAALLQARTDAHGVNAEERALLALLDLGPPAGGQTEATPARTPLLPALSAWLRRVAAAGPLVLVVDDLHHADAGSVHLLAQLLQEDRAPGLAWVLAQRSPVQPAEGPWAALAQLQHLQQVALEGLGVEALQALIVDVGFPADDAAALARELHRHTGGHPLFALETLRELAAAGAQPVQHLPRPRGVGHLIDARIARLSRGALALARLAAVAVPDFSIEMAESVIGVPAIELADAWQELQDADVLRGEAFAHDLIQDAALRQTPEPVARRLHVQVAGWLAGQGAEPARVAQHWWAGRQPAQAAEAWGEAVRHAERAGQVQDALRLLDQAAQAWDQAGRPDRAFASRLWAVEAAVLSGDMASAQQRAAALAEGASPGAEQAEAQRCLSHVARVLGQAQAAEAHARAALAHVPPGDHRLGKRVAFVLANALSMGRRPREGAEAITPWLGTIEAEPDVKERIWMYGVAFGCLFDADRLHEALRMAEAFHATATGHGLADEEITSRINLLIVHLRLGQAQQAAEEGLRVDALLEHQPQQAMLRVWNRIHRAVAQVAVGELGQAVQAFSEAGEFLRANQQGSALLAIAEDFLGALWLTLGQAARAKQVADAPVAGVDGARKARRLILRAHVQRVLGQDPGPALEEASAACGPEGLADTRLAIGIERLHGRDDAEAAATLAALGRQAEERAFPVLAQLAALQRLRVLARLGPGPALAEAASAVEQGASLVRGFRVYFPEQMLACCQAYAALGQQAEARRCAAAGLRWVEQVACPSLPPELRAGFLERNPANRELRALGVRLGLAAQPESSTTTGA